MRKKTETVEFRQGQVWMSPKKTWYRVVAVRNGQASLRTGLQGTGRIVRRPVGACKGWYYVAPLVSSRLITLACRKMEGQKVDQFVDMIRESL